MPITHPKINALEGGWYVVYADGKVMTMTEVSGWKAIPNKKDIKTMGLKFRNKQFELTDKVWLPPGQTGMKEISIRPSEEGAIVSTRSPIVGWFIGYYDLENKCKVRKCVNKITGEFSEETEPYDQSDTQT
jgi:hypothetical protein